MGPLLVRDLGRSVPYAAGMEEMRRTLRAVGAQEEPPTLLLLEHRPVITLTRAGGEQWLKRPIEDIEATGVEVCQTDRGGDVTFHGPGQLVGYPIVQLARDPSGSLDLVGYIHRLEAGVLAACAALGCRSLRTVEGKTGVWVGEDKLVAIGVGVGHRGVTRHGFALNIDIDLGRYTELIVPCGLAGLGVTSLAHALTAVPPADEVRRVVADEVARALGFEGTRWAARQGAADPSLPPAQPQHPAAPAADSDGALHG